MLSSLKIAQKLPIVIVSLCVMTATVTGLVAVNRGQNDLVAAEEQKLLALQASRVNALENYLSSIEQDLSSLSKNDYVRQALRDFEAGWNELAIFETPLDKLQALYIDENPNPTGSKEKLDAAEDGSRYSAVHKKYHPWFRHFLYQRDYYDIFLIDTNGDLIYSVFKELDYATNLNEGEWKKSDLANAFRAALKSEEPDAQYFFDFKPYAPSHGAAASFISQAIYDEKGSVEGVLIFQMPIARINSVMQVASGMGESGETYIVGADNYMRSDSRFSEESTILKTKVTGATVDAAINGETGVSLVEDYRGINVFSAYGPFDFNGTRWAILAEIDEEEVMRPIAQMKRFALIATLAVIGVATLIALYFSKSISKPITAMVDAMNRLSKGDYKAEVPAKERSDEVGDMARSVQVFKDNGIEGEMLKAEQEKAEGRAKDERKRLMNKMAEQFDKQVGGALMSLVTASEKLLDAANEMETTAAGTQESSAAVVKSSDETSANVNTVASATEEMVTSAQEISMQVGNVATRSSAASQSANSTSQKVQELNDVANNIGEVVEAIRGVAEQTNLLALNATIESARAGEAGKGFAVVAEEVKALALETGRKTDDIEDRIAKMQVATSGAVAAVQEIIANVTDIDDAATQTAAAAEEQNAVLAEINHSINQMSGAVQAVTGAIGNVQSGADKTGEAAKMLKAAANEIAELSDNLGGAVEGFLNQIRDDEA